MPSKTLKLLILLLSVTSICYSQSQERAKYDIEYVNAMWRKNKDVTLATKLIITGIKATYDEEEEQLELISFYRDAYDFKGVDKEILRNLIDSLSEQGMSDEVMMRAAEAKELIEYRLLNKTIQDFAFPDKNGQIINLSSLNDKVVIVELWATWCAPCIKEMSKISELRQNNPNIEFYSISLDKTVEKMTKFINKKKYDWPIVFGGYQDINPELWEYLHIVAVPKYYTIDRSGTVINVAGKLDEEFINDLK